LGERLSAQQGIRGMLSKEQLVDLVLNGEIETILLVFTDHYGRLMGKRFDAEFYVKNNMVQGANVCNYLLTVDMEMGPVQGYAYSNWQTGYGDFRLEPDYDTLRQISWLDKSAMIICNVVDEATNTNLDIAPRSILNKQIKAVSNLNLSAKAGTELEYFIFKDSYKSLAKKGYSKPKPIGWYIKDYHMLQGTREETFNGAARKHLKNSGVPVETSKGEWGKGQHELNVQYADIMTMADRHCVFKQCLKEIADQQGISVTFMAKYSEDQAGSSCHIHISLWQENKNAFVGNNQLGPIKASNIFKWFLGGWIKYVPDVMVFYAPTINSYKRYQAGSWAPTRLAWSYDNRTAGFRVVGKGPSLRIECRIPGADCNPYLALAASLASGLKGIKNKIGPPEIFKGNVYAASEIPHVPKNLQQATQIFKNSDFAKKAFGKDVVEHYAHFYETEIQSFENAVTDWERKRYFERI
jgi:glutamine synthetase